MHSYKQITLLITHYNRSKSLERLLQSFKNLSVSFGEIIVSDDGSQVNHLDNLKTLQTDYHFKLITSPINKGLGHNINKGQDAVKTLFTLYIQEDFIPLPALVAKLTQALKLMTNDRELDFIRFYAYTNYPFLKGYKSGFSEMIFKHLFIWQGYKKFYLYSDHPHLRRSDLFKKFGRYKEGFNPERTEYNMMMKVLKVGPKAYFYQDFKDLLVQENTNEEPSTLQRNFWRNNENVFVIFTRHIYRYLRFNIELLILKFSPKR
jgi:glycosyltransferase involved in cell wall biosynthesis